MATTLYVAADFSGYRRGQVITDPVLVAAILVGPYSDQVRQVITTTSGAAGQNSISGVPTSIQVNTAIGGTYTASSAGEYVCVRLAGADILPRMALSGQAGTLPLLVSPAAGTGTVAMYAAATGGTPLFETGSISFTLGAVSGIVLPANALLIGTDANGNPQVVTLGAGLAIVGGKLTLTGAISTPGDPSTITLAGDLGAFLGVPGLGESSSAGTSSTATFSDGSAATFSDGTPVTFSS